MNLQPLEDRIVVRPARPRRRRSAASSSPTPPRRSPSRARSSRWARAVARSRPVSSSRVDVAVGDIVALLEVRRHRDHRRRRGPARALEPRRARQGHRERQEEVALTTRDPGARGGRQRIPRPATARAGAAAPWASLASAARSDHPRPASASASPATCRPRGRRSRPAGRPAAVLLPAVRGATARSRLVLTRRPETMPSHRGRDRVPGRQGGTGASTATPRDAALREAEEEIGLRRELVDVIADAAHAGDGGRPVLDHAVRRAHRRPSGHHRRLARGRPGVRRRAHRAARRRRVPRGAVVVRRAAMVERSMQFYELADETVWGATARILTAFLARSSGCRSPATGTTGRVLTAASPTPDPVGSGGAG